MKSAVFVSVVVMAIAALCGSVQADIIADFAGQFQDTTPATGWRYMQANSDATIGTQSAYASLPWDMGQALYSMMAGGGGGGWGYMQSAGAKVALCSAWDGWGIASYTVQPGQAGNGSISRAAPHGYRSRISPVGTTARRCRCMSTTASRKT